MMREGREDIRREGRGIMRCERSRSHRTPGRGGVKREELNVMGHEDRGYVTACAGSTGIPAIGEAAAPRGWTALSGVW